MKNVNKLNHFKQISQQNREVWNRNFTLLMSSTILGSIGAIAGIYALSFVVYEQTQSVFASALSLAIRLIPSLFLPLFAGPLFDRLPRKPVLVAGDFCNGLLYLTMGFWMQFQPFSYLGYLFYSLLLACSSSIDELAYDSILPMVITQGKEQKSYAAAGMVYPLLNLIMMPIAAVLMKWIGVPMILIGQGCLSLAATWVENHMHLSHDLKENIKEITFKSWLQDLKKALAYLKNEPGLLAFFVYSAFSNGIGNACSPILIAFFSSTPGLGALSFSFFSVAESMGRLLGGASQYLKEIKPSRRYGFSLMVMIVYNIMDGILLLLPYPFMLANRFCVGTLGSISFSLRTPAIQSYIPESMRARINSFQTLLLYGTSSLLILVFGWIGDFLSATAVMMIGAGLGMVVLFFTWIVHRQSREKIFLHFGNLQTE